MYALKVAMLSHFKCLASMVTCPLDTTAAPVHIFFAVLFSEKLAS